MRCCEEVAGEFQVDFKSPGFHGVDHLKFWSLRSGGAVYTGLSGCAMWRGSVPAQHPSLHPLTSSHDWEHTQVFGGGKLFWWLCAVQTWVWECVCGMTQGCVWVTGQGEVTVID